MGLSECSNAASEAFVRYEPRRVYRDTLSSSIISNSYFAADMACVDFNNFPCC